MDSMAAAGLERSMRRWLAVVELPEQRVPDDLHDRQSGGTLVFDLSS